MFLLFLLCLCAVFAWVGYSIYVDSDNRKIPIKQAADEYFANAKQLWSEVKDSLKSFNDKNKHKG